MRLPGTYRKTITQSTNDDPSKAEPLSDVSVPVRRLSVTVLLANTGTVYVGFKGTSAQSGAVAGTALVTTITNPEQYPVIFEDVDLQDIYVAGTTDGDGITYDVM